MSVFIPPLLSWTHSHRGARFQHIQTHTHTHTHRKYKLDYENGEWKLASNVNEVIQKLESENVDLSRRLASANQGLMDAGQAMRSQEPGLHSKKVSCVFKKDPATRSKKVSCVF